MTFQLPFDRFTIEGEVLPPGRVHGLSLSYIWVRHSPQPEEYAQAQRMLKHIFADLYPVGYRYLTLSGKTLRVHYDDKNVELVRNMAMDTTALLLATDEFDIAEDQLREEVRRTLSDFSLPDVTRGV